MSTIKNFQNIPVKLRDQINDFQDRSIAIRFNILKAMYDFLDNSRLGQIMIPAKECESIAGIYIKEAYIENDGSVCFVGREITCKQGTIPELISPDSLSVMQLAAILDLMYYSKA